jgi:hypothetical protein
LTEGLLKEEEEAQNIENLVVFGREQEYKEGLGLERTKRGIHLLKTKLHPSDETLLNFIKRKHPKKGKEKETRGKDQSPASKQAAQMKGATRRKGNY